MRKGGKQLIANKKNQIGHRLCGILLAIVSFLWIFPLFRTIMLSFADESAGKGFSLQQYRTILLETPTYLNMYWNSVLITGAVVCGSIVISLLGAYAFTMLQFRGKELIYFFYMVVMLLPLQVTMMPNYLIARLLHIDESWLAIILPAICNPFGVFLLRQQMRQIPWECVEAARMDGAGTVEIFRYVFLPMVHSGVMALVMLLVIEYWNLVDQVVVFIRDPQKYPLSMFLDQISRQAQNVSYASSAFYLIPVIALLLYGHKDLKDGIGLMNVREK